jgi:hypothetical protein
MRHHSRPQRHQDQNGPNAANSNVHQHVLAREPRLLHAATCAALAAVARLRLERIHVCLVLRSVERKQQRALRPNTRAPRVLPLHAPPEIVEELPLFIAYLDDLRAAEVREAGDCSGPRLAGGGERSALGGRGRLQREQEHLHKRLQSLAIVAVPAGLCVRQHVLLAADMYAAAASPTCRGYVAGTSACVESMHVLQRLTVTQGRAQHRAP